MRVLTWTSDAWTSWNASAAISWFLTWLVEISPPLPKSTKPFAFFRARDQVQPALPVEVEPLPAGGDGPSSRNSGKCRPVPLFPQVDDPLQGVEEQMPGRIVRP